MQGFEYMQSPLNSPHSSLAANMCRAGQAGVVRGALQDSVKGMLNQSMAPSRYPFQAAAGVAAMADCQ